MYGPYVSALLQLEAMLQELAAREAARRLPAHRFAFAGLAMPGRLDISSSLALGRQVGCARKTL